MRNSKERSGYTFWLILQKTFAAFSHRKLKVVQIWSIHQSKAVIFYFVIKKNLSWVFENFVGNRQTQFHILNFRVCKHTLNLNSWNVLRLFPTKFLKIWFQIVFMPKKKIGAFDWWVDHICAIFNFRWEKAANVFCKMSQKVYPERTFEVRLSILI